MNRALVPTSRFNRALKGWLKSHPDAADAVAAALDALAADAHAPHLRTHKLRGQLAGQWACTVSFDCRIVFRIETTADGEEVVLLAVGTHDDVY